ncbi:uncharacterized protein LOC144914503 [Branchiostoma floridae x Branchiostoma belcheri]
MKKFIIFFALVACARADFWSDLWDGVQTTLLDPIIDTAQQTAQTLIDTYVPVLGQAAQQLVGEAIQGAGESLTNLVSGKKRQVELQTEIGQIFHDGIMGLFEGAAQTIQSLQNTLTQTMQGLFSSDPVPATRVGVSSINKKSKVMMKKRAQMMKVQLSKSLSKMARARGFFDDLTAAAGQLFAPVVDAATQSFNQLVDAATAVGAQLVDHATNFVDNVSTTFQETVDQLTGVAQPYIDDANTIIDSVTNTFQENFGAETTA